MCGRSTWTKVTGRWEDGQFMIPRGDPGGGVELGLPYEIQDSIVESTYVMITIPV